MITQIPLTRKQRQVLTYLRGRGPDGAPPTNAEIALACGLGAPSGAHRILSVLAERGYVERPGGRSRAVTVAVAPLGPHPPGSPARFVLESLCVFQADARDRVLRMAADPGLDTVTKGALLRDATRRNDLLERYRPADGAPGDVRAGSFRQLLARLETTSTWPEFLVDHTVLNEGSRLGAEQLLGALPELEPVFLEVIDLSEAALAGCREWIADLLRRGEHDRAGLEHRALLMQQVSRVSAGFLQEQLSPSHALGTLWSDSALGRLLGAEPSRSRKT